MKPSRILLAAFLAVFVLTASAFAADVSGRWRWTSMTKTGGPSEVVAALTLKGGVLTGTVAGRQGPADIADASVKGDLVSFTVTRSSGNSTVVFKYSGQLSGNTIKGTVERTASDGKPASTKDWVATRSQ